MAAFAPAIQYARAGINLLGDSAWTSNYDLCLTLHSKLAALESSTGHIDESSELIDETIRHAQTFDDKLPVYTTLVESLSVQGKLNESLDLAFEVLEGLGESFPDASMNQKRFEHAVKKDTAITRQLMQKHTNASILNLPLLKDRNKQWALKIMNCKLHEEPCTC